MLRTTTRNWRRFLAAHPEVARNPEFYLFSHLKHEEGQPDEALERAVWPDVYRSQPQQSSFDRVWGDTVPLLAFACGLTAIFLLARMFIENRRWARIFKLQSEVHGKLIDKFTSNQELAAYMETEAGRKFLEAAPIPVAFEQGRRMPNAVARMLTPLQVGIVMVLLGIGLLLLRHAGPDMDTPMLVFGTVVLMPGIGFIISAGVSWLLAARLGLMPADTGGTKQVRFASGRFLGIQGQAVSHGEPGEGEKAEADALGVDHSERAGRRGTASCRQLAGRGDG